MRPYCKSWRGLGNRGQKKKCLRYGGIKEDDIRKSEEGFLCLKEEEVEEEGEERQGDFNAYISIQIPDHLPCTQSLYVRQWDSNKQE